MPLRVGPLRAGALQAGCARPIQAWTGTWGRQRRRKVWPAAASSTHPVPLGSGSEVLTQLRSSGKPGRAHLPFLEGPGSQKPEMHTAPLLSTPPPAPTASLPALCHSHPAPPQAVPRHRHALGKKKGFQRPGILPDTAQRGTAGQTTSSRSAKNHPGKQQPAGRRAPSPSRRRRP